jgi:hypothetical protein
MKEVSNMRMYRQPERRLEDAQRQTEAATAAAAAAVLKAPNLDLDHERSQPTTDAKKAKKKKKEAARIKTHITSCITLKVENGLPPLPSPLFFHLPAMWYIPCLSTMTVLDGPAYTCEACRCGVEGDANCVIGVSAGEFGKEGRRLKVEEREGRKRRSTFQDRKGRTLPVRQARASAYPSDHPVPTYNTHYSPTRTPYCLFQRGKKSKIKKIKKKSYR